MSWLYRSVLATPLLVFLVGILLSGTDGGSSRPLEFLLDHSEVSSTSDLQRQSVLSSVRDLSVSTPSLILLPSQTSSPHARSMMLILSQVIVIS